MGKGWLLRTHIKNVYLFTKYLPPSIFPPNSKQLKNVQIIINLHIPLKKIIHQIINPL